MNKIPDLKINRFQLNVLLTKDQKEGLNYILNHGVYCVTCRGSYNKGMEVIDTFLTSLNDIMVKGTCKVCQGKVTRIIEFGEDQDFFNKANNFRKSIKG
jgi:hypothetical protein